jgi:hypothetical protein
MPKARRLIEGASFDPEELETIIAVFEEIWMSVSENYDAKEVEEARGLVAGASCRITPP